MKNRMRLFWTKTYRKNIAKMIGVCYRYVPDQQTAEDLAHEAFLTAIEKADTFRGTGSFERWLMRIAVNKALLYLRYQEHVCQLNDDVATESDTQDDGEPSHYDMMAAIQKADFSREEILDAITQLPDRHRTVLNLYVFERITHQQIAEMLDISPNTSKSHLMRARKELQMILFNKSKEKKRLFMIPLPIFIHPDMAIDSYCRRQLKGFAIPPTQPLTEQTFPATSRISPRLWIYTHKVHVTAGIAAVGTAVTTAGILLTCAPQDNTSKQPRVTEQHPPVTKAVSDSLGKDISAEPAPNKAGNDRGVQKHFTSASAVSPVSDVSVQSDISAGMPEEPQTVVVKKIRHTNRIIVIQDSTKQQ